MLVAIVLAIAPVLVAGPARAQAVDAEDGFAARIAQERAARGLPALAAAGDLQAVARQQAQRMADRGEPYHNPNLGAEVGGWSMLAENVGMGPDVGTVHRLFMESSQHREAIVSSDLTQLGVGVVRSADGYLWVVEVFRRPAAAASPAPAPAPAPPVTSAPPPPAPPTTAAAAPPTVPPPSTTSLPVTSAPAPTAPKTTAPATEADATAQAAATGRAASIERIAAHPVARRNGEVAVVVAVDLGDVTRQVPPAAGAAAFLLAAVVALQGYGLRRMGLVAGLA